MRCMDYFASPSALAYALLFAGIALCVASVAATLRTVQFRTGSPASVTDHRGHRFAGIFGAALLAVGAAPLLAAPVATIVAFAAR